MSVVQHNKNPNSIPVEHWVRVDRAKDEPRAKQVRDLVKQSHKYRGTIVAFRQENLK